MKGLWARAKAAEDCLDFRALAAVWSLVEVSACDGGDAKGLVPAFFSRVYIIGQGRAFNIFLLGVSPSLWACCLLLILELSLPILRLLHAILLAMTIELLVILVARYHPHVNLDRYVPDISVCARPLPPLRVS